MPPPCFITGMLLTGDEQRLVLHSHSARRSVRVLQFIHDQIRETSSHYILHIAYTCAFNKGVASISPLDHQGLTDEVLLRWLAFCQIHRPLPMTPKALLEG